MSVDLKATAEAIVASINEPGLLAGAPTFTAERGFITVAQLHKLGSGLTVRVAPTVLNDEPGTRGGRWEALGYVVNLATNCDPTDNDEIDTLIELEIALRERLEEAESFNGSDVESVTLGGGTGQLYDPELLLGHRVFLASVDINLEHNG